MGRKSTESVLHIYMNGISVGILRSHPEKGLELVYDEEWQKAEQGRSLSLSLPLFQNIHKGPVVERFFDNLLPDSVGIRNRIQARFGLSGNSSFDILSETGSDCIGALQLLPGESVYDSEDTIKGKPVSGEEIEHILRNYATMPLGIGRDDDFRISLAGAQEKTALLWYRNKWYRPTGTTPTSHIIKLPIGSNAYTGIDLSDSVENEWLCHLILKEYGIPIAHTEIHTFGDMKTLVVERFDRKWSDDKKRLIRLPQEDMCQAMGISPVIKYESDGGPGIIQIMDVLNGSENNISDRYTFMKSVFLFWIMGAIDGHGKNFSIFHRPQGRFVLAPLYDVMSVYPLVASGQLSEHKVKMAMSLSGKSKHYKWKGINLQHWFSTAEACRFPEKDMSQIIDSVFSEMDDVITKVEAMLPGDFPGEISGAVFDGMISVKSKCLL